MDKHQSKIIILASLLISGAVVFFALRPKAQSSVNIPGPAPIANVEASQLATVGSPDGKMSLTMKQDKGRDSVTYTFLVTGESNGLQKQIFTKTVPTGTVLSIPYNSFSPDNKYVFLKETDPNQTSYFVMTVSGDPVAKDVQFFDISSLFMNKYSDYKITDVTGWGDPALVIINTDKKDGGTGPSFWFEVPSQSFIQLSQRFN